MLGPDERRTAGGDGHGQCGGRFETEGAALDEDAG